MYLILLLIGIIASQATLQDFVLCVGADGHVALEAAVGRDRTCETFAVAHPKRAFPVEWLPEEGSRRQHCGVCTDLVLVPTSLMCLTLIRHCTSVDRIGYVLLPQPFQILRKDLSSERVLNIPHGSAPLRFSLIALRSTVLLV